MMRYEDVSELVRIIDSSSCTEVVLDTAELKLVVRRNGAGTPGAQVEAPKLAPVPTSVVPGDNPAPEKTDSSTLAKTPHRTGGGDTPGIVEAPMIGTFYRAPSPGAAPFVEIGTHVQAGDPLCLIEVMKLYTTIFSPKAGFVREICAADNELVEYGRALFVIEPQ